MRIRKIEADLDRKIITGLIVSTTYIKSIKPIFHTHLLKAAFSITVAQWCFEYFDQYDKAPGKHIQDIFYSRQREGLDGTQSDLIETFLESLSNEYERADKFNTEYLLDQTEKLFRSRNLKMLSEDIEAYLSRGELEEAESKWSDFKKLERPRSCGIDPIHDFDAYKRAFAAKEEPLFKLPGAYGEMLNPHMIRGGAVLLLGRSKVGKTWRLLDIAFKAAQERCNVAVFHMGDLSEEDHMMRQGVYFSHKSNDKRYCGELLVPVLDCMINQKAEACPNKRGSDDSVWAGEELDMSLVGKHKVCTYCRKNHDFKGTIWYKKREPIKPMTLKEAWEATQKWAKRHRSGNMRLKCFPNSSASFQSIENQLDLWETLDGFVADVVVIDYFELIEAVDKRQEKRHQEDEKGKHFRRMSQERHALMISATQTNRGGFSGDTLNAAADIGEDKRKLDHVTALFTLNQTEDEEEAGIIRMATGIVREGKRDTKRQVRILQSLETGQSHIASYYYYPPKKGK